MPELRIFQNARDCHGRKRKNFNAEKFRQSSTVLRRAFVNGFGFMELDGWMLTAGLIEKGGDGWHFSGTVKQMQSIILINMICSRGNNGSNRRSIT